MPIINKPMNATSVTPSDVNNLISPALIYCGGAGNVKVTSARGSGTVTFQEVPAGTTLDLVVKRVWSGSTTCSGIVAMW